LALAPIPAVARTQITAILRELTYSNIIVQEIAALLLLKNVQTENAVLEESAME
jgi:hypothetical protein